MAAPLIYHVLTEFKFEVGNAILGSEKLAGAVDQVSASADNALHSFQRLGVGLIASMGLGSLSLLGILGSALQSSDKFAQSQRDIANIITSNAGKTMSWNDALALSAETMANINQKAREFSLSSTDLLSTSKQIGAVLLSHGLDRTDLSKSVDISRQYLKSAPTLGIDPQLAQQQLVRAILGQASGNDTLFNRLTGETASMKQFGAKGGTQSFNALAPAQRLDLLTRSLGQFSSNLNYVKGNAQSLSGEMRILGENMKGPFSIFKSLGDVISKPVLMALNSINNYLQTDGRALVENFSRLIEKSLKSPQAIFASFFQIGQSANDMKQAGSILTVTSLFRVLKIVLKSLNIEIPIFTSILTALGVTFVSATAVFGLFAAAVSFIGMAIAAILPEFIAWYALMQLISRARGYAKAQDLLEMPAIVGRFTEALRRLKFFFQPVLDVFDSVAQFISPLFMVSTYAKIGVTIFEKLANALLGLGGIVAGIVFGLLELNKQVVNFALGKGFDFTEVGSAFKDGMDNYLSDALGRIQSGDAIVSQNVNINKVEIKNQFKENMEPDRIAFSLTKQLMKVAQNPTQRNGGSIIPVGAPS